MPIVCTMLCFGHLIQRSLTSMTDGTGCLGHCISCALRADRRTPLLLPAAWSGHPQLRALGYTNVTVLSPGQATSVKGETGGRLRVQTAKGECGRRRRDFGS